MKSIFFLINFLFLLTVLAQSQKCSITIFENRKDTFSNSELNDTLNIFKGDTIFQKKIDELFKKKNTKKLFKKHNIYFIFSNVKSQTEFQLDIYIKDRNNKFTIIFNENNDQLSKKNIKSINELSSIVKSHIYGSNLKSNNKFELIFLYYCLEKV
jgi:hypothetical protein